MQKLLLYLFVIVGVLSCAGNNFDESAIPQTQLDTELAFKRLSDHGGLEPVVNIEQKIENWQFHISSYEKNSVLGSEAVIRYGLKDRSGIAYEVNSETTDAAVIEQLNTGAYGFGTGVIVGVERDLVAAEIAVILRLKHWQKRED